MNMLCAWKSLTNIRFSNYLLMCSGLPCPWCHTHCQPRIYAAGTIMLFETITSNTSFYNVSICRCAFSKQIQWILVRGFHSLQCDCLQCWWIHHKGHGRGKTNKMNICGGDVDGDHTIGTILYRVFF